MVLIGFWSNHNACTGDDTHQEIWHQSSDDHHDALHHGDGAKESKNEVEEVLEARPELHHVVGNRARWGTEQHQEREGGEEVGKGVCCYTIVPIEPLCIEHLLPSHQQREITLYKYNFNGLTHEQILNKIFIRIKLEQFKYYNYNWIQTYINY